MSGYTLNVGTGTVTRDMLIALEEERDAALARADRAEQRIAALETATERLQEAWTHEHWDRVIEAREALFILAAATQEAGAGEAVTEAGRLLYAAANAHFWAAEDGTFDENEADHDPEKDKAIHQGLAVAMNRWMAAMGNKTAQAMLTPAPPAPRRSAPISAESTLFAEQTADAESGYDGPPAPRPGEQEADGGLRMG